MVRELTIAVLASVVIFICYKQAASSNTSMAAKSALSALHSVVYVTVPNITVAKQIARYEFALIEGSKQLFPLFPH